MVNAFVPDKQEDWSSPLTDSWTEPGVNESRRLVIEAIPQTPSLSLPLTRLTSSQ
jgi:hypothetical protein